MEYRPLNDDEIRLLTLRPGNGSAASSDDPVCCTLEHVKLGKHFYSEAQKSNMPVKGATGAWPEVYERLDFRSLWHAKDIDSRKPDPSSPTVKLSRIDTEIKDEETLTWRYKWGDYVALSYVWGHDQKTRQICVNGISLQVTDNLEAALRRMRQHRRIKQGFKIWADAICIDQSNVEERGQQVSRMRDIYALAWDIITWLGVEAADSSLAMTVVRYLSTRMKRDAPLDNFYTVSKIVDVRPLFITFPTYKSPMRKEVYPSLYHLLNRPYWRRLWILQEVALSRSSSPVLCGAQCALWEEIYEAARFIQLDAFRFGKDIVASVQPKLMGRWSWDFAWDRLPGQVGLNTSSDRLWTLPLSLMAVQKDQQSREEDRSLDVTDIFSLSHQARATDQKDRVYGILGISSVSNLVSIKSDYSATLSQVYYDFSKALFTGTSKGLNALRSISSPVAEIRSGWTQNKSSRKAVATACTHDLPSWVICWACAHSPTIHLRGHYRISGDITETSSTIETYHILRTTGILFDTVNSLSAFHAYESNTMFPFDGSVVTSVYGDFNATKEAFWRTVVAGTSRDGAWAPEAYSFILQPKLWQEGIAGLRSNNFGLHDFMRRNKRLSVLGFSLMEIIYGKPVPFFNYHGRLYDATEMEREALSWAMNVLAWRRLITTKSGYLGLAAAATEPHDRVCIIFGCDVPMVLRPDGDGYRVIGECYIQGIMRGEIAQDIEDGHLQVEQIRLH